MEDFIMEKIYRQGNAYFDTYYIHTKDGAPVYVMFSSLRVGMVRMHIAKNAKNTMRAALA